MNTVELVQDTIISADYCMISYIDTQGYPVTKAMLSPRIIEDKGIFWFSTNTSSNKIKCFRQNDKASLYFVNRKGFVGVSLIGNAFIIEDIAMKYSIWREGDERYYKKGVTDEDYSVLKFVSHSGRLYANVHSIDFSPKIIKGMK